MTLRSKVIRLAHSRPDLRPHLLPLLQNERVAMEFPTEEARNTYLEEHLDADPANHTVSKGDEEKGKSKNDKPSGGIASKFKSFFSKVKNAKPDIMAAMKSAPEKIQAFFADPEARKKATTKAAEAIAKAPEKLINRLYESAKDELKEIKHAGSAIKKLFKKPPEKWDKKDKKAVYAASVYVAGAALAASGGGPLVAAGALGKSFAMHVGMKALHHVVDHGFLHFEAGETALHALHPIMHVMEHLAADENTQDEDYEKTLIQFLTVAVQKILEKGLSDEDMEAVLRGEEPDPESIGDPKTVKAKAEA
jgi:hypothetical protein